jgi:hypothetical protein
LPYLLLYFGSWVGKGNRRPESGCPARICAICKVNLQPDPTARRGERLCLNCSRRPTYRIYFSFFVRGNGQPGGEWIIQFSPPSLDGALGRIRYRVCNISARAYGDVGVVTLVCTWTGVHNGSPFDLHSVMVDTWRRTNGRWQVVSRSSCTPTPASAGTPNPCPLHSYSR